MGRPRSGGKWCFVSFQSAQSVQISNKPEFSVDTSNRSIFSPNDAILNNT